MKMEGMTHLCLIISTTTKIAGMVASTYLKWLMLI